MDENTAENEQPVTHEPGFGERYAAAYNRHRAEHTAENDVRLTDAERAVIASAIPYGILTHDRTVADVIAAVELVLATRVIPPGVGHDE